MKIRLSTFTNLLILVLVFVVGIVAGDKYGLTKFIPFYQAKSVITSYRLNNTDQPTQFKDVNFGQFWEVWSILESDYIDPSKLDDAQMVQGAIGGMTAAIGDPYTVYLPPVEDQRAAESLAGSFYGVGIELGYMDEQGSIGVMAPIKGSPADKAGIQAGDYILRVKDQSKDFDEDTTGWTLQDAVNNIRGQKGTEVTLTLFRKDNGGEPFQVTMARDEIVILSVELEFTEIDGKRVAHVIMSRFGDRTHAEWNQIVDQILAEQNNIKGVVLDLRNNPGGYFDGSIDIASDFIKNGVVVTQQGKYSSQDFKSQGQARLANIPTVVVVNKGTASASEIVAGALRDDLGIKLVGENTYGKGTVQDRRELADGGGLHVTVARWLLPGGSWIHEEGLKPDVEAVNNPDTEQDEVLQAAVGQL